MTDPGPKTIKLSGVDLEIPMFFPSISTVKTALSPLDYLEILHRFRGWNKKFLISAFDFSQIDDKCELINAVRLAEDRKDVVILMDSGNYETFWKEKKECWKQFNFHDVLRRHPYTFSFGFDEQDPPPEVADHVALIVDRWQKDHEIDDNRTIIPIMHVPTQSNWAHLLEICPLVAQETMVPMIAVAERELGSGILERAKTVMFLREALGRTGRYVGLHLLGTGDPISIALYSVAGANSFDGLEWYKNVVDRHTGLLSHLSHADFFPVLIHGEENRPSFRVRTLEQNLRFYVDWMQRLRTDIHDGNGEIFCRRNFPQHIYEKCAHAFKWEN